MTKHLYLIIISTFLFGFVSGVIIFLSSNTGKEGDGSITSSSNETSIVVTMYGGCSRDGEGLCPTYRIADDGSYTFIAPSATNPTQQFKGSLTTAERTALMQKLGKTDFVNAQKTVFTGECPVNVDGIAYRYDIETAYTQYAFDSCKQNIESIDLFTTLNSYFETFTNRDLLKNNARKY